MPKMKVDFARDKGWRVTLDGSRLYFNTIKLNVHPVLVMKGAGDIVRGWIECEGVLRELKDNSAVIESENDAADKTRINESVLCENVSGGMGAAEG